MSEPRPSEYADLAGMSDEAVARATGRTWSEWVAWLDEREAVRLDHPEIAKLVAESGASAWWSQTVTVGHERIRGLREVGQRRGGAFDANRSRTAAVSRERLFGAWDPEARAEWLDIDLEDTSVSPPKSRRMKTSDGSTVALWFTDKGAEKSSVGVQASGFPDRASADRAKEAWGGRLDRMVAWLTE